jgi:hypothetical protein
MYIGIMSVTTHSTFRLSAEGKALLLALAAHYGLSQTGALEFILRDHAREKGVKPARKRKGSEP